MSSTGTLSSAPTEPVQRCMALQRNACGVALAYMTSHTYIQKGQLCTAVDGEVGLLHADADVRKGMASVHVRFWIV